MLVCETMIMAQNHKLSSDSKKQFVLSVLKKTMSIEIFERYSPLLSLMIDGLKELSRTKLLSQLSTCKYKCY